jgi:class 3 adenylate cyclase
VARLSAEELAELVPCPPERVTCLRELGLLTSDEDGLYPSSDVHVVRLMAAFEEAGISLQDVARGVARGELSYPLELFMPEPVGTPETYAGLAPKVGRSPKLLRRLTREMGLPPPDHDRIREEDAEMLSLIVTKLDLADEEDLSRFARLYGGTIQRLVTAGIQFFDRAVRQRVDALDDLSLDQKDRLTYEKGGDFSDMARAVVPWLQSRHRERGVIEYLVGRTESWLEERGIAPRPPRHPPAIAFLDLTGYTTLAEERGDEAAAEVASELAAVVQEAARTHGGRPVKWLGDGVMFHFGDPAEAIRSGLELVEQTERAISVPARIGINAGAVVVQEGDYFGRTVNVAARIADYAGPRDVLVSEEARESADVADVDFELVGDVRLKGVTRPVRLHRATRPS